MPIWSVALPRPPVPSPRILWAIAPILAQMQARPAYAGPIVAEGLRATRTLGSKERPVAGDLLLGLVRHHRALARIDPDPLKAWLRLAEEGPPDLPDPDDAYAVALSLPRAIADEWWARLGPDAAIALAVRLGGRAPVALRVLRDPVDLPVPHRRTGRAIVLDGRTNLTLLDAWKEGRIEVQDLGSQAIVDFVGEVLTGERGGLLPGARILDLCAGAGGKSLALAALGARVQAWDTRRSALDELLKRAGRAGLDIRVGPPRGGYDLVLVDAPCSGSGVLRRHPENRWKMAFPTDTQEALLRDAVTRGKHVVYATCSLLRAENEDLVRRVAPAPIREATVWPDADHEGFFMAQIAGS